MHEDLSYTNLQTLTRRIISGKLFYLVDGKLVCFKDPTLEESYIAEVLIEEQKQTNEEMFPTLEESIKQLIELELWSIEEDKKLKECANNLSKLKDELARCFNFGREAKLRIEISKVENQILKLNKKKYQLIGTTSEFQTDRARKRELIKFICRPEDILTHGQQKLIDIYFEKNLVDTATFRNLARTNPWRILWDTSKKTGTPIVPSLKESITEYQQSLFYWSAFYDYVFEHPEKPGDLKINDDTAVDKWVKKVSKQTEKGSGARHHGDVNSTEVFKFAGSQNEAKEIYEQNDPEARQRVREIIKETKEKGSVPEQELPSMKRKFISALKEKGLQ